MTDLELKEIEKRLAARTQGDWSAEYHDVFATDEGCTAAGKSTSSVATNYDVNAHNDLSFIAHAPADIRALLDEVKSLREQIQRLEDSDNTKWR